jgi:diguanylate cyclase (GGDEF)-like protein/PAS domain S-box-containing protein
VTAGTDRDLYEAFFHAASDLFIAVAPDGEILAANPSARSLFGVGDGELGRWRPSDSMSPADRDAARAILQLVASGEEPSGTIVVRHVLDDRELVVEWVVHREAGARSGIVFAVGRDLTEVVRTEHQLAWVRELLDRGSDVFYVYDLDGVFRWCSDSIRSYDSFTPDDLVGQPGLDYIHPEDRREVVELVTSLRPGEEGAMRARVLHRDGHYLVFDMKVLFDGERRQYLSIHRDVTGEVSRERELRRTRRFFDSAAELFVVAVADLRVLEANRTAVVHFAGVGGSADGLDLARRWGPGFAEQARSLSPGDELSVERVERSRDGTDKRLSWSVHRGHDGELHLVGRDVTHERRLTSELRTRASTDELTGLANRTELHQRMEREIEAGVPVALLLLDLDEFKLVNDSLGHAVGDELLRIVAERLRSCARPGDVIARIGGDEFVVLLPGADLATAEHRATRIVERLAEPIGVAGRELQASASVGVASGGPGSTPADLLREADTAAYHAKSLGRNRIELYDDALRRQAQELLGVESGLRSALRGDELLLHYQAITDLTTGSVVGAEALVRWQHPTDGLLFPGRFIEVAERSGTITLIGEFVLDRALAQLAAWHAEGRTLSVTVNVSPKQLAHPRFPATVELALREHGVDPHAVVLEITESALERSVDHMTVVMHRLRSLGVRLAIDDFGTGYSSLGHLRNLPVDMVKLDRSFITDLRRDGVTASIAAAVVELGRALSLDVVAEGVESPEVAEQLRELGCDLAQGYLFHRPGPADSVAAVLERAPIRRIRPPGE